MTPELETLFKVPYTTRPSMTKNVGPLYTVNPDGNYLRAKEEELAALGSQLWGTTHEAAVGQLVERACRHLGLPPKDNIVDFALQFQEDVAILHHGLLAAICFCFPSGWVPGEGVGKSLAELHGPVADGEHLRQASERIAKTLQDPVMGGFYRPVWTITANGRLSNHPRWHSDITPSIEGLYLRTERQTTQPLGDGATALFFVDVAVTPLADIWPLWGDRILASINSMSDAVIAYKNLGAIKTYLNTL